MKKLFVLNLTCKHWIKNCIIKTIFFTSIPFVIKKFFLSWLGWVKVLCIYILSGALFISQNYASFHHYPLLLQSSDLLTDSGLRIPDTYLDPNILRNSHYNTDDKKNINEIHTTYPPQGLYLTLSINRSTRTPNRRPISNICIRNTNNQYFYFINRVSILNLNGLYQIIPVHYFNQLSHSIIIR